MRIKIRVIPALLIAALLMISLCGCTRKLATIRPRDVYIEMERLKDGAVTGMPNSAQLSEMGEALVLQLEAPYDATGDCGDGEAHKYHVTLVRVLSGETEIECFINDDSSVCKNGRRYVAVEEAAKPVDVADWDDYFDAVYAAQQ